MKTTLAHTIQEAAIKAVLENSRILHEPIPLEMSDLFVSPDESALLVLGSVDVEGVPFYVGTIAVKTGSPI